MTGETDQARVNQWEAGGQDNVTWVVSELPQMLRWPRAFTTPSVQIDAIRNFRVK